MTDRTRNRGYVYPECDPPLVKDRSDIWFLQELATGIDTDAAALSARITDFIEKPDAARIGYASTVAVSGTPNAVFTMPYTGVTYDNTAGSTDLTNNGLRPRERGWYLFCSTVRCLDGGGIFMSLRHLRNGGAPYESRWWEGPSDVIGTEDTMATLDVMYANVNDLFQTQVMTQAVAGTYTFESRLTMIQVQKLDV